MHKFNKFTFFLIYLEKHNFEVKLRLERVLIWALF